MLFKHLACPVVPVGALSGCFWVSPSLTAGLGANCHLKPSPTLFNILTHLNFIQLKK